MESTTLDLVSRELSSVRLALAQMRLEKGEALPLNLENIGESGLAVVLQPYADSVYRLSFCNRNLNTCPDLEFSFANAQRVGRRTIL